MKLANRRICVVVNSRANYGRIKSVLRAVKAHPALDLQLVVGASALLQRFGGVRSIMEQDGFVPSSVVHTIIEGETPATMAKSAGLGVIELSTQFESLKPDIVLTVADRFETIATAIAASYMNIPVAHTQGGEITGSIDECVRHAVTKLSHLHFPATELAKRNVIRMGEDPSTVFWTGCPAIDLVADLKRATPAELFSNYKGVGAQLDPDEPYIVVLQHPVTTEYGKGFNQICETLEAVRMLGMQAVWLWPNVDAGSDDVSKGLRMAREHGKAEHIHFYRNFSPEDYGSLIIGSSCIVGNSSSALREGAFLGIPAVNIGTRQQGRERGENVVDAGYDSAEILRAMKVQVQRGRFPRNDLFGSGNAGLKIAEILATVTPSIQKRLHYGATGA